MADRIMERITRHIKKHENEYDFTTYAFVMSENLEERCKKFHPNFYKLCKHLQTAFINGMPKRDRSASQATRLMLKVKRIPKHKFTKLAASANARGTGWQQHPKVQKHFMDNDRYTIALEVPCWDDKMNCLIDIVLINPKTGLVTILDYKPDASREKKASTQIYYNRKMLCGNTGIGPEYVACYYFDDLMTYQLIT